jgi:hypothetical protein
MDICAGGVDHSVGQNTTPNISKDVIDQFVIFGHKVSAYSHSQPVCFLTTIDAPPVFDDPNPSTKIVIGSLGTCLVRSC